VPGGQAGAWLSQAAPGQAARLKAPLGRFFIRDAARPLLMIGGGTGIAPILSMVRSMGDGAVRPPRVDAVFGVTRSAEIFYQRELADALAGLPQAALHVTAMQGDPAFDGFAGTAVDAAAALAIPADVHAYLCGPSPMIAASRILLKKRGVRDHAIFAETFLPSGDAPAGS
jgi:ferredoxin-NADP reductase